MGAVGARPAPPIQKSAAGSPPRTRWPSAGARARHPESGPWSTTPGKSPMRGPVPARVWRRQPYDAARRAPAPRSANGPRPIRAAGGAGLLGGGGPVPPW